MNDADEVNRKIGDVLVESVELGRGNRRWLKRGTVALMVDVLLSLAIGSIALSTRHLSQKVDQQQQDTCRQLNAMRAGEVSLWSKPLSTPPAPLPPDATGAQRMAYQNALDLRADFAANLSKYFGQLKC